MVLSTLRERTSPPYKNASPGVISRTRAEQINIKAVSPVSRGDSAVAGAVSCWRVASAGAIGGSVDVAGADIAGVGVAGTVCSAEGLAGVSSSVAAGSGVGSSWERTFPIRGITSIHRAMMPVSTFLNTFLPFEAMT